MGAKSFSHSVTNRIDNCTTHLTRRICGEGNRRRWFACSILLRQVRLDVKRWLSQSVGTGWLCALDGLTNRNFDRVGHHSRRSVTLDRIFEFGMSEGLTPTLVASATWWTRPAAAGRAKDLFVLRNFTGAAGFNVERIGVAFLNCVFCRRTL